MAKGKHARAICDRSGFEYPMSEMVLEPGTGYLVHYTETDGAYNIVDHPQNFPPAKLGDDTSIENARPETEQHDLVSEEILDMRGVFGHSILDESGNRIYGV